MLAMVRRLWIAIVRHRTLTMLDQNAHDQSVLTRQRKQIDTALEQLADERAELLKQAREVAPDQFQLVWDPVPAQATAAPRTRRAPL